jgi:hypothetical protein
MVAGTKYRGQFEERIKALMAEVENDKSIILLSMKFILLLVGQVDLLMHLICLNQHLQEVKFK